MKKNFKRPKWWVLYLLTFVYLLAFWLELKADFSDAGHIWAEAGLTCAYFGLVFAWLNVNETAMWFEDQEKSELSRRPEKYYPIPESGQRTISAKNGNRQPENAINQWFSRVMPAWFVALFSTLGEFFKGLH